MRTELTAIYLSLAGIVLLGGCTATPSSVEPEAAAAVPQPEAAEPEADPIDLVLAERRRGDYPEIETEESGFTITEQVRVRGDAYTRYDRALGLLQQQRYQEAIAELTELTADAPDLTAPYVDLGIAYGQVGDLEQGRRSPRDGCTAEPGASDCP